MKVVILGGNGLLGEALVDACRTLDAETIVASRSSKQLPLDIAERDMLGSALAGIRPDVVINSAAISSIDACEENPGLAYTVNARPVAELAALSKDLRFKLVQISTDHFFTGDGSSRHDEDAPVTLLNEYARGKYAAERFALLSPGALVVRTAFVGRASSRDRGFAEQIHSLLRAAKSVVLFEDAYTSLLHRSDCANLVLGLIGRDATGVVNVASSDVVSKADLIRAFARGLGLPIKAIAGSVKSLKVPRAESLGLSVSRAEALLRRSMPSFADTMNRLAGDFAI